MVAGKGRENQSIWALYVPNEDGAGRQAPGALARSYSENSFSPLNTASASSTE